MSNHYHLLINTPQENLGEAMKYFHREVARLSNRKAERINHFFGGRYKWCLIYNEIYFWNAVKYIFRNPVAAGVVNRVQDYKYSSLNTPSHEVEWNLVDVFCEKLGAIELDYNWLNQEFTTHEADGISKGLRRREFKITAGKNGYLAELRLSNGTVLREKGTVT